MTANLDFRFTTIAPGTIVLDVDNTPTATNFYTVLHLFNSQGVLLATNDDSGVGPGDSPGLIGGLLNSTIELHRAVGLQGAVLRVPPAERPPALEPFLRGQAGQVAVVKAVAGGNLAQEAQVLGVHLARRGQVGQVEAV